MVWIAGPMSAAQCRVEFDEQKIDSIFAHLDQTRLPGAAVGIAIDGRPVYRKGFGLASMELPVVLSPSIRMRIGSTTKHFTALACMLLCEEGRAGIDDPIGSYFPELHPVAKRVTLRQLMGNIGGLRDACDIALRFSGAGRQVSSEELLTLYRDIDDVNAAPGTTWIYNNGGYVMLSAVIEQITGRPLEDVLRERIFEPVGMNDTMLRRFDTDFVANSATLHMTGPATAYEKAHFGIDFSGAGAMVSTVTDMLRWLAHMESPIVGIPATWATMKAPQTLANGTSTGYGLGLMIGRYRGVETLSHPGGGMGGNAQMIKVPVAGLDVIVMVNRQDALGIKLACQILDSCLPDLESTAQISAPLARGTFHSSRTGRVVQLFAKDEQQIVSLDGFDVPFVAGVDGALRPLPMWSFIKRSLVLVGDPESPSSVHLTDFGAADQLVKVPPGTADRDAVEGRYRSDQTGSEVVIRETRKGVGLFAAGRFGSAPYDLECIGAGIWRARPASPMTLGGMVSFDQGGSGFQFFSYGTRSLPFRRCA